MPQKERRLPFDGTDTDYVNFLEERVISLEKTVDDLQRRKSRPHPQDIALQNSPRPQAKRKATDPAAQNKRVFSTRLDETVGRFLQLFPSIPSQWDKKRETTGLVAPEQAIEVFHILTRLSSPTGSAAIGSRPKSKSSPLEILNDYYTFASHLKQKAEKQTQLSRYAALLFLGICSVTRQTGLTVDHVNDRIKAYFGKSEYSTHYCGRMRTASKWCAKLMGKLEASMGRHGPELLLLCGPDIAFYNKLSESPGCLEDIAGKITSKVGFLYSNAIEQPAISFSMPFMLAFMGLDLQCVNKALGTTLSEEDYASRARAVESLASHDHNGQQQQGTALGSSYEPDGFQHGHIIEASVRESINDNGNDVEWMKFINWGNNTSEMDIAIAGDSSTGVL